MPDVCSDIAQSFGQTCRPDLAMVMVSPRASPNCSREVELCLCSKLTDHPHEP